jgi:hypothetical protein
MGSFGSLRDTVAIWFPKLRVGALDRCAKLVPRVSCAAAPDGEWLHIQTPGS